MRLDKFLKLSRVIKRRTVANDVCQAGRVSVNGRPAKAGTKLKIGDIVTVLFGGAQPKTGSVAGTTRAHVAVVLNEHANVIVATCAIDNVGKGAAGQAIQCANIVFGLPETCGLQTIAIPA